MGVVVSGLPLPSGMKLSDQSMAETFPTQKPCPAITAGSSNPSHSGNVPPSLSNAAKGGEPIHKLPKKLVGKRRSELKRPPTGAAKPARERPAPKCWRSWPSGTNPENVSVNGTDEGFRIKNASPGDKGMSGVCHASRNVLAE